MPPKAKFNKEEIINAGIEITSEKGIGAVTARELAHKLGSSSRPLFTLYDSIEQIHRDIINEVRSRFVKYTSEAFEYDTPPKEFGIRWVRFASDNPRLYKLIYENFNDEDPGLLNISNNEKAETTANLSSFMKDFDVTEDEAKKIYSRLLLFGSGVITDCLYNGKKYTDEEISEMYSEVCYGLVMYFKSRRGKIDISSREFTSNAKEMPKRREKPNG